MSEKSVLLVFELTKDKTTFPTKVYETEKSSVVNHLFAMGYIRLNEESADME